MNRRGFFGGIAAMITGGNAVAVTESPLKQPGVTLASSVSFENCNLFWMKGGKSYQFEVADTIDTAPNPLGIAHRIKLAHPVMVLKEVS
jgi:hypothetical protein